MSTKKLFYATLNSELLFTGLTPVQVELITSTTQMNYKFVGQFGGLSGRKASTIEFHEDEIVKYQFDSFSNEEGESYHTLITTLSGEILKNERSGDWVGNPDASFSPVQYRGRVECLGL